MQLPLDIIPNEIIKKYNLRELVHDGKVYIEIRKGMYGLRQAGILANKLRVKRLETCGYYPVEFTPDLWQHKWRPIIFSLVVDDFGVKYTGKENADHLIQALMKDYTISIDLKGEIFCGITLNWEYIKRTVNLSIPV
jgi:hypothetical protein